MLSKTVVAIATSFLGLVGAQSAWAVNAPSITPGNIKFSLDNYDSATTQYGNVPGLVCNSVAGCDAAAAAPAQGSVGSSNLSADTMGIFSVSNISNLSTGSTLFTKSNDGYITGIFGNLADRQVEVSCGILGCQTAAVSAGGTFQLWWNPTDYDPTLGPLVGAGKDLNNGLYPGVSGGTLLLSGVFAPGAVLFGDMVSTYLTQYNNGSFGGSGQGFLDVTGGLWFSEFNTNSLTNANGGKNDLFLTNTFDDVNGAASGIGWTVKSVGQVTGNAVPEASSVALVALALLGLKAVSRRRKTRG